MAKKILLIRFHAFGDIICSIPYIAGIKNSEPNVEVHLLTTRRAEQIPAKLKFISKVISIAGGISPKKLFFFTLLKLPYLKREKYDLVIDLQNDRKSAIVRRFLNAAESTFDKYAPKFAGQRYLDAINKTGLNVAPVFVKAKELVNWEKFGDIFNHDDYKYVVINPAGFYRTRNWPIENYIELIELFLRSDNVKILIIGDDRIRTKAALFQERFSDHVVNLVNATDQVEAYSLLSLADLVVSEDSGLGHMSWVQGVQTLFLFGSTRADWTAPPYEHVINLTSSDLDCGDCMKETCIHGDVRCLTRYTPLYVYEKAITLLHGA